MSDDRHTAEDRDDVAREQRRERRERERSIWKMSETHTTQKIDLDALEAALAKKSEKPWGWADCVSACVENMPALIAELRELRARVTPEVIREKHKDGNWWLVWSPLGNQWYKALWHNGHWEMTGRLGLFNKATHALPLPPALEVRRGEEVLDA